MGAGRPRGVGDMALPVLDSDVLIDHLRNRGDGRELVERLAAGAGYVLSAVTVFEVALGREYERAEGAVDALLDAPCLPLSREAAFEGARILRVLRSLGRPIDTRDAMQAGICIAAGATLVTRNLRHFERVERLDVLAPDAWPP
jgi:tRNA(fMet)-specific endonuclease VapC